MHTAVGRLGHQTDVATEEIKELVKKRLSPVRPLCGWTGFSLPRSPFVDSASVYRLHAEESVEAEPKEALPEPVHWPVATPSSQHRVTVVRPGVHAFAHGATVTSGRSYTGSAPSGAPVRLAVPRSWRPGRRCKNRLHTLGPSFTGSVEERRRPGPLTDCRARHFTDNGDCLDNNVTS